MVNLSLTYVKHMRIDPAAGGSDGNRERSKGRPTLVAAAPPRLAGTARLCDADAWPDQALRRRLDPSQARPDRAAPIRPSVAGSLTGEAGGVWLGVEVVIVALSAATLK